MLVAIRNALYANRGAVDIPNTHTTRLLSGLLFSEGYIEDILYQANHLCLILARNRVTDLAVCSTPGRPLFVRAHEIPTAMNGLGTIFLSTSYGLLTDSEARRLKVGGEVLCAIW
jgi:small subunit ribosomal protein S8